MSRTITGIIIIMLGALFVFFGAVGVERDWADIIFGAIFVIVGIFILFNKKEDDIEKIKDNNLKNK